MQVSRPRWLKLIESPRGFDIICAQGTNAEEEKNEYKCMYTITKKYNINMIGSWGPNAKAIQNNLRCGWGFEAIFKSVLGLDVDSRGFGWNIMPFFSPHSLELAGYGMDPINIKFCCWWARVACVISYFKEPSHSNISFLNEAFPYLETSNRRKVAHFCFLWIET